MSGQLRSHKVNRLFDRIAPRYDLMNDLMSFGLHRLWKRRAVAMAAQTLSGLDGAHIDLAAGTGDLAKALRKVEPERDIILVDASDHMLDVARQRCGNDVRYLHARGEAMPVAESAAACVTLSFGLRNMTDPMRALCEVARVLQPGGSLVLLEFSRPATWFAPFYALHARLVIPVLGVLVARDPQAYRYLVQSIRQFPRARDVSRAIEASGLQVVEVQPLFFGVAVLHRAIRP